MSGSNRTAETLRPMKLHIGTIIAWGDTFPFFAFIFLERIPFMELNEILSRFPREETRLIDILLEIQKHKKDHLISNEEIRLIADYVGVSEAKVCGVISFYSLLSSRPRGAYVIQICRDIPCHVNKQNDIVSTLEQILGIRMGETTPNGLFSLEYASCLGHCGEAPAMRIDGRTYVHLTPDKVKAIVAEYRGKIR